MSQKFCDQVTAAMKRIGRTVECVNWGTSGGRVSLKTADGNDIVQEYERGRAAEQVTFLGSSFKPHVKTGNYDTDRVVGLLLTYEAGVLKERAEQKVRDALRVEYRKRYDWTREITGTVDNDRVSVGVPYEHEKTYYNVTIRLDDKATVMAVIDHLRDNGYIDRPMKEEEPVDE